MFSNFLRSDNRPALDQSLALQREKISFTLRQFYQLSPQTPKGLLEMPLELPIYSTNSVCHLSSLGLVRTLPGPKSFVDIELALVVGCVLDVGNKHPGK